MAYLHRPAPHQLPGEPARWSCKHCGVPVIDIDIIKQAIDNLARFVRDPDPWESTLKKANPNWPPRPLNANRTFVAVEIAAFYSFARLSTGEDGVGFSMCNDWVDLVTKMRTRRP